MTPEPKTKPKKRPDYKVMAKCTKSDGTHDFIEIGLGFFRDDIIGINVLLKCLPMPNCKGVAEIVLYRLAYKLS